MAITRFRTTSAGNPAGKNNPFQVSGLRSLVFLHHGVAGLFCQIAGVAYFSTGIDAVLFFAVSYLRNGQQFVRHECLYLVYAIVPVGVFRQVDNYNTVLAEAAISVVNKFGLASFIFAR
jgi:hypothetical protein